jgi:hypothetical protein
MADEALLWRRGSALLAIGTLEPTLLRCVALSLALLVLVVVSLDVVVVGDVLQRSCCCASACCGPLCPAAFAVVMFFLVRLIWSQWICPSLNSGVIVA